MRLSVVLIHLFPAVIALKNSDAGPTCSEVSFTVHQDVLAETFVNGPDPNNETQILDFVGNLSKGVVPERSDPFRLGQIDYRLNATYCLPTPDSKKRKTLQILVHGLTYNKTMWQGFGYDGESYNWHQHANAHGYATFAIDLPGHGNSAVQDPFLATQPHTLLNIITLINSAAHTASPDDSIGKLFAHKYRRTVYVGHSCGFFHAYSPYVLL